MTSNHRKLILAAIALLLFTIAFFPVFMILGRQWANSEDYAHAFIVLPIVGYMVWQKRQDLNSTQFDGSLIGLLIILSSVSVYLVALHARINSLASVSMVMTIFGALVYLRGINAVKILTTPFILLLLLIPIPSSIYSAMTLPLQLKVSQVSEIVVKLLSVPIFREGNVLTTPEKTFQIVEACSGMRSMITLVTLSLIMGYFTFRKKWTKLVLILASIPVAIFVNIVRVVVLILAFHFYKIDLSEGTSHTWLGMAVFAIALVTLFSFQRIIEFWEIRFKKS